MPTRIRDDLLPSGYRFVRTSNGDTVQLGSAGGFGAVYLGTHDLLRRRVAIKLIKRAHPAHGHWVGASSVREAQTMARLNHRNIVRVYDLAGDDEVDVIVMEHVGGGSISDVVGANRPDRRVRLRLIIECARGLGYLHRSGLIHRDIKPDNVLISSDGVAKIADFGLVTTADLALDPLGDVIALSVAGTPAFWAPEQGRGDPLQPSSDVFSLGKVARVVLGLVLPPPSERTQRRSLTCDEVIERCLCDDADQRPADGDSMADLLEAAADGESPGWRTSPWSPELRSLPDLAVEREYSSPAPSRPDGPALTPVQEFDSERSTIGPAVRGPRHDEQNPAAAATAHIVPTRAVGPVPVRPARPTAPPVTTHTSRRSRSWLRAAVVATALAAGALVGFLVARSGGGPEALRLELSDGNPVVVVTNASTLVCPAANLRAEVELATNGVSGTIRFRWIQLDGSRQPDQSIRIGDGVRRVVLPFESTITGSRDLRGTVALDILEPVAVHAESMGIEYRCS